MFDEPLSAEEMAELQQFFLRRLTYLLDLRNRHEGRLNTEGQWLIRLATFSTFCDCRTVGVAVDALALLQRVWEAELSDTAPEPASTDPAG